MSFTAYNDLCIFAVHKPFSLSYPNAIELRDRYPQALVDYRFSALLERNP